MKAKDVEEMLGTPARLAILVTVADGGRWAFTALRDETGLADGNLHVQTRKLTAGGFLSRDRMRLGNRTVTCFELTERGRQALEDHLEALKQALGDRPRFGQSGRGTITGKDTSQVW